jgi:hypothetical protein
MSDEHCSVEQLAKFFRDCRKEIIDEWLLRASELLRELKLDPAALADHVGHRQTSRHTTAW